MSSLISSKTTGNTALLPAIIGAAVCLFLLRSGFATLLFLLPLGFIGFGWGPKTLWPGVLFAILGNCVLTLFLGMNFNVPGGDMVWDILYFSATAAAFAWIILPFEEWSLRISGSVRLAVGACLCTLIFIGLFVKLYNNPSFNESLQNQVEMIAGLYFAGINPESLNIEGIIELMKLVILRGGGLFTSVLILFVNRQISIFLIRLFGGPRRKNVFLDYHVNYQIIWLLVFSLILLLVSNVLAWSNIVTFCSNVVVLCIMMYLAQGLGIIRFLVSKPDFPPFLRFILPAVFVIMLFWPGLNAFLLGGVIILGIIENWVVLRPVVIKGPPSTPEA